MSYIFLQCHNKYMGHNLNFKCQTLISFFSFTYSFHTKRGKACTNPESRWVKDYIQKLRCDFVFKKEMSPVAHKQYQSRAFKVCVHIAKFITWLLLIAAREQKSSESRQSKRVHLLCEERR